MDKLHSVLLVGTVVLVTVLLRFLPFLLFRNRKTPKYIEYLGRVLPYSIMGMLVVYCLKNVSLLSAPYGIPEFIACLSVAIVHIWKRNTLFSILTGTVLYMVLVQFVF